MSRRSSIVVPALAVAGLAFAAWTARPAPAREPPPPPGQPPRTPYEHTVAGSAVVEPAAERTTALGTPFAGLVLEVRHAAGDTVAKDEPLFRLDDRPLLAARSVLEAQAAAAQARLDRLLALPRAEDFPPAEARVEAAKAALGDRRAALARLERAASSASGVLPEDDVERARWGVAVAERAVATAQADLDRVRQPAWAPDVAEARAALASARAAVGENSRLLERAIVRAPCAGTILELNVHPGEYAAAGRDALILFGDLSSLRVRVDVDEESAPLVPARPRAVAVVRGFPEKPVVLEFVRAEPWVRPKRSLTGTTSERVDTRVLQVVFRLGKTDLAVRAGQQVDVFMEGAARDTLLGAASGETTR